MKVKLIEHNDADQLAWNSRFEDTREYLTIGCEYDAVIEEHSWHTFVIIDGRRFNSVVFEYDRAADVAPSMECAENDLLGKLLDFVRGIKKDCETMLDGDGWECNPDTVEGRKNWLATLDNCRELLEQATGSEEG